MELLPPKRPANGRGWTRLPLPSLLRGYQYDVERWYHRATGLTVISAVEAPEAETLGAEYHLSISKNGGRCDSNDARAVLADFGVPEAKEDNHTGGISRHFWRPLADHLAEYECPCVEEETAVVEDKGDFVWRPLELTKRGRK